MRYSITNDTEYLLVAVTGKIETREEWLQYARDIKNALVEFGRKHILIDRTEAPIDLYQSEVIDFVEVIEKRSELTKTMRVAVLVAPALLAKCRQLETPFVNRSMSLKFFEDKDAATRWLLGGGF